MRKPQKFEPGDRVENVTNGEKHTVKRCYWQEYAGGETADYTVEFEPSETQRTPWNKSCNLRLAE